MALDADRFRLSQSEHQAIFDQAIKPDLFSITKPSKQPVALIFGGQPGSGKSSTVEAVMREFDSLGGAIEIIGDDLRVYHPHYASLLAADDSTAAFYTDRNRPLTVQELRAYADGFDRLAELLARPRRKASAAEIRKVDDLRESAKQALALALSPAGG